MSRLVRLRDGVTVAALGIAYGGEVCTDSYEAATALSLFHRAGTSEHGRVLYGMFDHEHAWKWAGTAKDAASAPRGLVEFDTDSRIFSVGKGAVYALRPPDSDWTVLESASSATFGAGGGELAVWLDAGASRLRAWEPNGAGVRTLLEQTPRTTCLVAVGSSAVVGAATDACLGSSNAIAFWRLPAAPSAKLRMSPWVRLPLSITSPYSIRTSGDYVAVQATSPNAAERPVPFFIVTRISTWQAWRVSSLAPFIAREFAWTLDDQFLYWAESDADRPPREARRMIRVPLAELDEIGQRIAG